MAQAQSGFTLVELVIVTAMIGVLAGIAVPNLVTSRAVANERAILATLRTIASAQGQVMSQKSLDSDNDGIGEALSLIELAGATNLRGTSVRLAPTALSTVLGTQHSSGFVPSKGYLIGLHLPDAAGTGVLGTEANFGSIDANQAEHAWTCLAWPVARGASGSAAFFVNQLGEILVSRETTYSGTTDTPGAGAGLVGVPVTQIVGGELASDVMGADGNVWHTLR